MNGKGTLIFPDNNKIEANFQNGGIVGEVTLRYSNNSVYKGYLKQGKENG